MKFLIVMNLLSFAGLTIATAAKPKIVGGTTIPISQAPYQVSIRTVICDNTQFRSEFFCSGSLITNSVVLTAAHCLIDQNGHLYSMSLLEVKGGHQSLFGRDSNTFVSAISSFTIHESYNSENHENDIAIIKLKTTATISSSSTVQLINLPTKSYPVGSSCLITGWGLTSYNGLYSSLLQGAYIPVNSLSQCNEPQYLDGAVKIGMFCAGSFDGGIDSCQGDSGGPLSCDNVLYGVTSFGYGCGEPGFPGVYTDVYYYREWILTNIAANTTIVQDYSIPILQAPYQVSIRTISKDNIQFGSGFFCGGALIADFVVLSAAHCLYDKEGELLSARAIQVAGGHVNVYNRNSFVSTVFSFKVHESYKHGISFEHNIALIKLKTNVPAGSTSMIKPVSLPTRSYPVGSSCFITGWASTSTVTDDVFTLLRGAYIPVNSLSQCNVEQYLNAAVKKGMFCAGSFNGGIETCQGDSGGPLYCDNVIYGVTSHGFECPAARYPGIYTDVYYYREWITQNSIDDKNEETIPLFADLLLLVLFILLSKQRE